MRLQVTRRARLLVHIPAAPAFRSPTAAAAAAALFGKATRYLGGTKLLAERVCAALVSVAQSDRWSPLRRAAGQAAPGPPHSLEHYFLAPTLPTAQHPLLPNSLPV